MQFCKFSVYFGASRAGWMASQTQRGPPWFAPGFRLGFPMWCDGQVQDKLDELQEKYDSETERRCLAHEFLCFPSSLHHTRVTMDYWWTMNNSNSGNITNKLEQHWILWLFRALSGQETLAKQLKVPRVCNGCVALCSATCTEATKL